ncbi:MAG: hypothetical protein PHG85_05955 [Candidatus Altiarchaeota archaeon]|nr:hypothetical protein [Candidatus Altiarchaeota archaeon]
MTNEVVVHDGHFWVNAEGILTKERRSEVVKDLVNSEALLLVDNCIWARIDRPLPTRRQSQLLSAQWKASDVETQKKDKQIPRLR